MNIRKLLCVLCALCLSPVLLLPTEAAKPRADSKAKNGKASGIQAAMDALENAKQVLARDPKGNRKALAECDRALVLLRKAMETAPR